MLRNPASQGRRFLKLRTNAQHCGGFGAPGGMTYPHNEQIKYSMQVPASLGGRTAKTSKLPAVICKAALRRIALGFPCRCINLAGR